MLERLHHCVLPVCLLTRGARRHAQKRASQPNALQVTGNFLLRWCCVPNKSRIRIDDGISTTPNTHTLRKYSGYNKRAKYITLQNHILVTALTSLKKNCCKIAGYMSSKFSCFRRVLACPKTLLPFEKV